MNLGWWCLVSRSVTVGIGIAILISVLGPPATAQTSCRGDGDCGGNELCALDRCVPAACNADLECTNRRPFCRGGICVAPTSCSADRDCVGGVGGGGCVNGFCSDVECVADGDCGSGRSCVRHQCVDCVSNSQCGAFGVCRDNACTCVECTRAEQCGFDQKCSGQNSCVDFCEPGRVFVSASDGNRTCKTCVNPATAPRCNEFPGCTAQRGMICAQGFCIKRCSIDPPDFDQLLDGFTNIRYQPDPDGLPDCPACRAVFDLAPVRTALERGGVTDPVRVRILHASGRVLADLGTVRPNRGSWASVPLRAQPRLQGTFVKEGGCGYAIEIRTATNAPAKTARAPICLRPR